jgi:hypothetical protein
MIKQSLKSLMLFSLLMEPGLDRLLSEYNSRWFCILLFLNFLNSLINLRFHFLYKMILFGLSHIKFEN